MDQVGERQSGDTEQPGNYPSQMNGCPRFTINECKKHHKSRLDTITIGVDFSVSGRLKFLIDTGAEISVVKISCMRPGFNYESTSGIDVRGISDSLLRTEGTTVLKLYIYTRNYTRISCCRK